MLLSCVKEIKLLLKKSYGFYIGLFIIFSLLYFSPVLKCDHYVVNWDSYAHLFLSKVLIEGINQHLIFPPIFTFGGMQFFQTSHSLFYYSFAILYFVLKRIFAFNIIWNIYLYLIVLALGLSSFFLFKKIKIPPFFAFLFAILVVLFRNTQCCSDFGSANIFGIGLVPFGFSWIWVPLWVGFFIEGVRYKEDNSNSYLNTLLTSLFAGLTFYSHFYTFLVVEIFLLIFLVLNLFQSRQIKPLIKNFLLFHLFLLVLLSPYLTHYIVDSYQFLNQNIYLSYQDLGNRLIHFFIPSSNESLDNFLFWIGGGGIIFLIFILYQVFSKKKLDNFSLLSKLLISYCLISFIFIFIIDWFKIKLPYEFAYAHYYGRFFAFWKYFYLFFGILGFWFVYCFLKKKFLRFVFIAFLLLMLMININKSIHYVCINCLNIQKDRASQEFETINSYLDFRGGGVLITPFVDAYYQKFLLPYRKNMFFFSEMATWWPTIKARNYAYQIFDNYNKFNFESFSLWLKDFGINYIISQKDEKEFNQLGFNLVYKGELLELWQRNEFIPLIQPVSNLAFIIDDELYFKDFSRALNFYKNLRRENLTWIVIRTRDLEKLNLDSLNTKIIVVGKVLNCSQLEGKLLKNNSLTFKTLPILSIQGLNNCKLVQSVPLLSLSNYVDKIKIDKPSDGKKLMFQPENQWKYKIKSSSNISFLVKINYDNNWEVSQNQIKITKLLALPQHMVIMAATSGDFTLQYKNDSKITIIIGSIIFLYFLILVYVKRKNL